MLKETTFKIKSFVPFLIAILTFVSVSIIYFSPVLKGDQIFQSDIQQFRGMSKEIKDFRANNDAEPYWTDAAFGGMPSYQLSTLYPNNMVKKLDSILRFLPRPADYLFLYFLGFFVLLLVLKVDWKLSIIGSLAFGFSTYFIIILGVGHNAKAHAIGYMPMVIAGFLLVFQNKLLKGFVLTTVAMALELQASHPQMTYYLAFSILFLGVAFLKEHIEKKLPLVDFVKQVAIVILGAFLALGMNASSLLATKEYVAFSTRGKSDLKITAAGKSKEVTSGLSKSYITEYSYGKLETFNLLVPRFVGGANSEDLGTESNTYAFLKGKIDPSQARQFVKAVPTYWGSQPIVAAPAYIGVIFIFLFVLGVFIVDSRLKLWLVATTIFSILMSWGHNFEFLTNFFIDYVPLYNKFRAVSSIQVLAEVSIPLLGMLALQKVVYNSEDRVRIIDALKKTVYILGGLLLFFTLFGSSFFSFSGANDSYYDSLLPGLAAAIFEDRKMIFFNDSLRSLVLVLAVATLIFMNLKSKLKNTIFLLFFGVLLLFDTIGVAIRYVNSDDFQKASNIERPFVKSAIDKEILKDKGHYRVANLAVNFMNDGATSYFHKSIGGYHAAKLGRFQDISDFHLAKNNLQVFNMFNTKYFITSDKQTGKRSLQINPDVNGNAWFVSDIELVATADEEILSLNAIDTKKTAIINQVEFPEIVPLVKEIQIDSLATIKLLSYKANELKYSASSTKDNLAVFSEVFYKDGWNAYVDGVLTPHIRANYILRALPISKGMHTIVFKFEPTIISKGNVVNLVSLGLFVFLVFIGIYLQKKYTY
ncbi:MAG: YfhO family protein [Flavicella sp.]